MIISTPQCKTHLKNHDLVIFPHYNDKFYKTLINFFLILIFAFMKNFVEIVFYMFRIKRIFFVLYISNKVVFFVNFPSNFILCFIFFLSELLFLISAAFWRELWKIFFKGYIAVVFGWKLIFLFDRFLLKFSEKVKVYCGICEFSTLWLLNEAYSTIFHGLEGLWAEILRQNFVFSCRKRKTYVEGVKESKNSIFLMYWSHRLAIFGILQSFSWILNLWS